MMEKSLLNSLHLLQTCRNCIFFIEIGNSDLEPRLKKTLKNIFDGFSLRFSQQLCLDFNCQTVIDGIKQQKLTKSVFLLQAVFMVTVN